MTRLTPLVLSVALVVGCGNKTPPEVAANAESPEVPAEAASPEGAEGATDAAAAAADPWGGEGKERGLRRRLDNAAALLTTGEEKDARRSLDLLQELDRYAPDIAEVHYNMGVAHEILGSESAARKAYLRATEIDDTLGVAWLNLGALSEEKGDYERALLNYRAGLKASPDDPDLVVGVIGVLRKMGRHGDAIEQAREALSRNANNINAYNNLGLVYLEQGNVDMALFIYQRALGFVDGADQNALVHSNLGRVYLAQDKDVNARVEFERALELDPELVAARMAMAELLLDNRDWAAAAELLEGARDLEPENPAIRVNLGIAYRGLGRFEESKAAYEKALDLDPANQDPRLNLAVLLGDHMKAYDQAIAQIETYRNNGGRKLELASEWEADLQDQQAKYNRAIERKNRADEARRKREERERLAKEAEEKAAREAAQQEAVETEGAGSETVAPEGSGTEAPASPSPAPAAPAAAAPVACSALGACSDPSTECSQAGTCLPVGSPGTLVVGATCAAANECAFGLTCADGQCADPNSSGAAEPGGSPWGG